jgi:nickel transport protein
MLMPCPARAHRLSVFAWVEGDTAHVQGKFAGGTYVQDGQVTVTGPQGRELVSGRTDEEGTFSFQIPQKSDLKVVVSAGMGHQGDWTIRADEITAPVPASPAASRPAESLPDRGAAGRGAAGTADAPSPPETERAAAATPEAIRSAVEQALNEKLTPVIRMLAEERRAIGPTEIFGGIGYIFGLVGVAAYFSSRRKRGSPGEDGRP